MSEREQNKPSGKPDRVLRCDEWENLIADALDGTLNESDAAAFRRHQGDCVLCAQMWKETHQGKAWMEYLTVEPEAPSDLLQKILARTSERVGPGIDTGVEGFALPGRPVPERAAWQRVVPMVRQVLEPRLMMTVAMAFFSIALTLNLTGIKLTEIRASDLQPSRVRANLTRQYYSTNEQVMKYYENLRLVYEMEARVRELKRSTDAGPTGVSSPGTAPRTAPATENNDAPKPSPRDGSPSSAVPSGNTVPGGEAAPSGTRPQDQQNQRTHLKRDPLMPAEMVHAAPQRFLAPQAGNAFPLPVPARFDPASSRGKIKREVFRALHSTTEDQAERSLV
jgi:hypothetical protein